MPLLEIKGENVAGEAGEGISILASPMTRIHCEMPRENLEEEEPEPNTCPNFVGYSAYGLNGDHSSLSCKINEAINRRAGEEEIQALIDAADRKCPLIRAYISLLAMKEAETEE